MPDLLADEVRKERQREYWRRYRLRLKQENPDQYQKMLERSRDWRRRNRKHCNEYNRNWSAAFPERRRKLEIRSRRKSTRRLSDGYVRLCLVVQQRRHGRMIRHKLPSPTIFFFPW